MGDHGRTREQPVSEWVAPHLQIEPSAVSDRERTSGHAPQESEELFLEIFEHAAAGIAHVAPDGCCLRANRQLCRILGRTQEELVGQSFEDITHPDDLDVDRDHMRQLLAGKINTYSVEKRYARKDGSPVPVNTTISLVRRSSGQPKYFIAIIQDITERKRVEEALRESQQRLDLLLQRPDFGMWEENVQTRQVIYSHQYAAMLGYSLDEIEPDEDSWQALLHPGDKGRVLNAWHALLAGKTPYYQSEYRLQAKNGEWKWVLSRAKICEWDRGGNPLRVLGTHLNVSGHKEVEQKLQEAQRELEQRVKERTAELVVANEQLKREIGERARIEKALRDSEERFRNLFENTPICVFAVDFTQRPPTILQANRQAERVYRRPAAELVGLPLEQIIPPEEVPDLSCMLDGPQAGQVFNFEALSQGFDNARFPVRASAATDPGSGLRQVILTLEDISVERAHRSEEEAIAEERRRIAREIHDGLAQDLASLRFKTRLWHDLLDRDPDKMHAELDLLRKVLEKNIRDVRRSIFSLRPVALEGMSFCAALRQFVDEFSEQNQLRIDLHISGSQDCLSRHLELMLFRIVQEALNNVGKYALAHRVWIELNLEAPGSMLLLRVRDDGVGFDPAQIDPDKALRRGHLGLKHIQERVEGFNGTFCIRSQEGEGTELEVLLPLSETGGTE